MKKEELKKFYDRYKFFIFPIVVGLLSLFLILLVIYPQIVKFLENQKKASELTEKSEFLEVKAKELENYDPQDLTLKVNSVLSSYPAEKDYINVLRILQNIVAQSKFTIVSLGVSPSAEGNEGYNMKLDVIGPVSSISTLLTNIESSYRLMRVSNLETTSGKDEQVNATILLNVLYASAPTGYGNTDTPLPQFSEKERDLLSRLTSNSDVVVSQDQSSAQQLGPRGKTNPFE